MLPSFDLRFRDLRFKMFHVSSNDSEEEDTCFSSAQSYATSRIGYFNENNNQISSPDLHISESAWIGSVKL